MSLLDTQSRQKASLIAHSRIQRCCLESYNLWQATSRSSMFCLTMPFLLCPMVLSAHSETASQTCPIPNPLPFRTPSKIRIVRRCTIVLSDPSQNHRLTSLASNYDILAVRPTTEKALQQACQHIDAALISLDLTTRLPFHFKHSLLRAAISRGIRFEICYAPGILTADAAARRNVISNAMQLARATRGRGIVFSSEAATAVGLRAPIDLVNLAVVWGLSTEKGREAIEKEPRSVVVMADLRRTSWRGVIDVIDGGVGPLPKSKSNANGASTSGDQSNKRKEEQPISKRQAKRARLEAAKKLDVMQQSSPRPPSERSVIVTKNLNHNT